MPVHRKTKDEIKADILKLVKTYKAAGEKTTLKNIERRVKASKHIVKDIVTECGLEYILETR